MQTAHGYGSDETALIKAAKKGHIDVVRVLVDAGARICNDMFFHVTLGGVRSSVPAVEFIRMMVDITSTDIQETGLIKVAKAGHIDVYRVFEEYGGADDRRGYGGSCGGGGGGGYGDPPPRGGYGDRGYRGYDDRRSGGYSRDRYPDSRDGGGGSDRVTSHGC
jgi:hypothetical protein